MVQAAARRTESSPQIGERRRQILAAASRVFRRTGIHSAGMREIAAECGMAVGNLYYYFRDKEELLAFCQEETLAGLEATAERIAALGLPADGELFLLIAGHVVRLNEAIPGALAHLDVDALGAARRRAVTARRDRYEGIFRDVVAVGAERGVFRRVDAKVAAMALLGAANWTVRWYRPEGPLSARSIGTEMAEIGVRGLLAPRRRFAPPSPALLAALAGNEEST